MTQKTVAIIGAGLSGLTAIKSCLDYKLQPICYEMKSELGGAWAPIHPRPDDYNAAQVYDDHITLTCKFQFVFSDFPHSPDTPLSIPRVQVLQYLQAYARHFDLEKHISFKRKVLSVQKADGYETHGRWTITTCAHGTESTERVTVDAVMICTGHFNQQHLPAVPNRAAFEKDGRTVIHTADFWNTDPYRGRRVAIIGVGVSGVDIATIESNEQ